MLLRLSLAFVLLAATACAQSVTFFDGTFNEAEWDVTVLTRGNGGTATGRQAGAGGNPGASRQVTLNVNAAESASNPSTVLSFHRKIGATYDPASQGPIASIDFSEDILAISACTACPLGQNTAPAIRQNGKIYSPPHIATMLPAAWTTLRRTGLRVEDFVENLGPAGSRPDFSRTGGVIELGFVRSNSGSNVAFTTVIAIDNWTFTINIGEPPARPALWLGNDLVGNFFQTDTAGTVLRQVPNLGVTGVAFDGAFLYTGNANGVIEKRTADAATVVTTFNVPTDATAEDMAWDSKRRKLWRMHHYDRALVRIDPASGNAEQTVRLTTDPQLGVLGGMGIAYDSRRDLLYISFCQSGVCNAAGGSVVTSWDPNTASTATREMFRTSGFRAGGMAYDPASDTLWVGDATVRNMSLSGTVLSSFTRPAPGGFVDGLELISPLAATPASLNFTALAGSSAPPQQPLIITSGNITDVLQASATTASGGNWLTVTPASGRVPGSLLVSADPAGLAAGAYAGTITIRTAAVPALIVPVTFTVTAAGAARLAVEPATLLFQAQAGGSNPAPQALRIANPGGGTLSWTAQTAVEGGVNWLAVSPASGSAAAASPSSAAVSANISGLAAGTYSGTVAVSAAGMPATVRVTLVVAAATSIVLSQDGLLFMGMEGAPSAPPRTLGILNGGSGTLNWTAQASTFAGSGWLAVSPASGSAGATAPAPLQVGVNTASLAPGQYTGLVQVAATGAANSPQAATVHLNVLPRSAKPPAPVVFPAALIFAAASGVPAAQSVSVATASSANIQVTAAVQTFEGGNWLDAQPRGATIAAGSAGTLTVSAALGSLAPGVYRGAVMLQFSDGAPGQALTVLLVVPSVTGIVPAADGSFAACTPRRLLAVLRTLGNGFSSLVNWPTELEAQVVDDCANIVSNATVTGAFSNGDPPVVLNSLRNGLYTATWRPSTAAAQVTVTARASLPPLAEALAEVRGSASANPGVPLVFSGGTVHAATFAGGALAPGSIVSVFGRNLAAETVAASSLPLPATLAGASLNIGGVDVPLFFTSAGQINAQLPFSLAPNTRQQVFAKTRAGAGAPVAASVPDAIIISAARPGVFTMNQQGTGQGAILDVAGRLVDAAAPVASGDVVQVFATGLGTTDPAVPPGQAAPGAEPLARVVTPVQATVGGVAARVLFAGLAPGFVGLYQVNVEIPAGVPAGGAVPLVLRQNDVPSNSVTLAVR